MKDPAFLFYSSDFLNGCVDLTMEERGQYITLLCIQHQKGILTKKSIGLSLGLSWDTLSDDLKSKFIENEKGEIFNVRLNSEIENRHKFLEKQRINGRKGGRPPKINNNEKNPNKPKQKPDIKPNHNPNKSLLENENDYINTSKIYNLSNSEKEKKRKKSDFEKEKNIPDFVKTELNQVEVYEDKVPPENLAGIENEMRGSILLEEACRRKTKLSRNEHYQALEDFFVETRAKEGYPRNASTHKGYFLNWVMYWKTNQQNAQKGTQQKVGKIESHYNAISQALKELNGDE